jgi:two-component system sensor histidine kinase KdpD
MARLQVETIGMVAHDLRSPLTGIALAADRLAGDGVPAARVAARAAIDRECARLLATAEDILSVCCDTAAHSDDDVGESISDVLEDVAARVRDAHGCAVIVDADLATRRLSADRGLARAVANVAENAARHSPPGCAVRFVAAVDDDTIELAIEDGGNGFDPAFRVSPFRRGVRGGRAGLGLASTRMIVERLGGSLRIGDRLGGGASVSLRVPRRGVPQ